MTNLDEIQVNVVGSNVRVFNAPGDRTPVLFLHGGTPRSAFASGAHIWGPVLGLFTNSGHRVIAPDLPGFGATALVDSAVPSFDELINVSAALLRRLDIGPVHIIGHDEGGLVALRLALDYKDLVQSITVVASQAAAPSGDGLENLTLAHPPSPIGSRASQAWALERLSYTRHHITPELLDACTAAAEGAAFRAGAAAPMTQFVKELMASKYRLFNAYRGSGVPVPVQLIWGEQDPISTLEHAVTLQGLIGARQVATHCHIVNRVGYFPYREEPEQFHRLVSSFIDGLATERATT